MAITIEDLAANIDSVIASLGDEKMYSLHSKIVSIGT